MENSLKGLILAAGIAITLTIVGLGFYVSRNSTNTVQAGADKINDMTTEFMNSDMLMYDGTDVQGSEVLNVINKYSSDKLAIVVTNKAGVTVAYGYDIVGSTDNYELGTESVALLANAKDSSHKNYINTTKSFTGEILYNSNEAIVGIHFTQK